jgi:hypothetical protein
MDIKGVGISRASKVLSFADPASIAIYDSRAADGLDLTCNGKRCLPIPPARGSRRGSLRRDDWPTAFDRYVHVVRHLCELAGSEPNLAESFKRAADFDLTFFARSKYGDRSDLTSCNPKGGEAPPASSVDAHTPALRGLGKERAFTVESDQHRTTVEAGSTWISCSLAVEQIDACLHHFRDRGWFPLSNNVEAGKRDPTGLGEYFYRHLKVGANFASNFAALWVHEGRLKYRKAGPCDYAAGKKLSVPKVLVLKHGLAC